MQQRITQFITLIRGGNQHDQEEDDQVDDEEEEADRATEEQLQELREQTEVIYKNLYWTRVISVQQYRPEEKRSWPVAPDLAEEYDVLFTIAEDELPELQPYFDPAAFVKTNPQPRVAAWKLEEEQLKQLALNVSKIRQQINEKAAGQLQDEEIPLGSELNQADDQVQQRGRAGQKYSTRASNPDGLLEKEIRAQQREERCPGRKYKKRPLGKLSSSEVNDIVHGYQVEFFSQEEIALRHGVTKALVSKLVCQARKEPEKQR